MRHPAAWLPYPANYAGSFTNGIVYLSSQPVPSPCRTSHGGSKISCATPRVALHDGDVFLGWSLSGSPSQTQPIADQSGRPITIGGRQAKIAISAPKKQTPCAASGGTRQVDIAIAEPDNGLLLMTACLSASNSHIDQLTNAVIASARTARRSG